MKNLKDDFLSSALQGMNRRPRSGCFEVGQQLYGGNESHQPNVYLGMGGRLIEYAVNILITLTAIALIDWRMALISLAAYVLPVSSLGPSRIS